ncbi:type I-E CRISPR-associated protein Cas6/Cse3/CasE [Streptomyces sp. NBC_00568]|uniref:type I-E CRISPR-associated protein Cas6/Cse3/CasE n=1 Tax=Streptomyces sp. NBC_00568 TaxID=2975779 RepID=UPI00225A96AC|nr:type I-E CRISPR-associated protein Cas6/Cse3/CasE [Streptomyces sp. NBC_00568]MCX4993529.1 type I-E CRISPR-associated protein Cas6/Cse3/CasE [Streptomyces sp. NBC_00568]
MYLTRFRFNAARTGARRLLSSPQSLHAAVMFSFPDLLPNTGTGPSLSEKPRVLWRVDRNAAADVLLYIVSPDQPDLTHLVEQAGWPAAAKANPDKPGWQSLPYEPFLNQLTVGSSWAFRLTANPVHHIRRQDTEPTKRTGHTTPLHQMKWLLDPARQENAGFRVCKTADNPGLLPNGSAHPGDNFELAVRDQRILSFTKSRAAARQSPPITLLTVTFDGRLEVMDPERLRLTLAKGLGKAKAYGCGLMTLAPAPTTSR